ncbi:hypothetical protein F4778DRAFT_511016 [Xylariomycetidae sp. FL2044]|nr:hypothetical protein F4778DRAFT_511016 [Xylariomycetidae sp. FL2044]
MSQLSPFPPNLHRSQSATSVAASDTTYHSFHDIELYEPPSPRTVPAKSRKHEASDDFTPRPIRRHDSGYGSIHTGSRSGASQSSSHRRSSTISNGSSYSHARSGARPSFRRAARSSPGPLVGRPNGQPPFHRTRSMQPQPPQHLQSNTYFHFPSPELIMGAQSDDEDIHYHQDHPPPQTTHYWTSDHTRRLEYAAIDAASRGVKGWILKHMVPDCFVPKENRRLRFDDDTGSVRRYRLDLDDCEKDGSGGGKKMGWLLGR